MKSDLTRINTASIRVAILWGLGQAVCLLLVCSVSVSTMALLQRWESSTDGFLDKVALLLLVVTAALVSAIVVLTRPAYLFIKKRLTDGILLVLSTILWLLVMVGSILIVIKVFDVHTLL